MLDPRVASAISERYQELLASGKLPSEMQLQKYYDAFRARFGPEKLSSLDGEDLLETLHLHANRDSLVYWLEFKNDDEFQTNLFGGIGGGTSLKFGLYRRNETGKWMAGSPTHQRELTLGEAIQIARTHRDQLIRGAMILDEFPEGGSDEDYSRLQLELTQGCPDICFSWGHKYLCLLNPTKLDDIHNTDYQRFQIVKLLQSPPEGSGRFVTAGRFVAAARELAIPLHNFTTVLGAVNGWRPYRYWRIRAEESQGAAVGCAMVRDTEGIAFTGPELGDLANLTHTQASKNELRTLLTDKQPPGLQPIGTALQPLFHYVALMAERDVVVVTSGQEVAAIGQVAGGYSFASEQQFPHRRPVRWLQFGGWNLPNSESDHGYVMAELRDVASLLKIERRLLEPIETGGDGPLPPLSGIPRRIEGILHRKGQVILYGPPGVGKTYWAQRAARELAARSSFQKEFARLSEPEKAVILGDGGELRGEVRLCCFHPAYGYEDFLEGYRPELHNGQMVFTRRDGIFKQLCADARSTPNRSFYLIIDEINRGDIPRIFGELLTILEKDKRDSHIRLPLSGEAFSVPPNVYVIGTMNTADRSIALLDTALRRRFGFIELMPDISLFAAASVEGIPIGLWLDALNRRICEHVGRDARNLQVGHSYLLEASAPVADFARFARIVHEDIIPLLEEYCYEDYQALEQILGASLVDVQTQQIQHDLFESDRQDELVKALLAPCPEIVTTSQAAMAEASSSEEADDSADSLVETAQ